MNAQALAEARAVRIGFVGPQEELERYAIRLRIGRACNVAHDQACQCRSLDAGELAHIASGFAARWEFRREATREDLHAALSALTHLHLAADAIERLEARDGA